MNIETQIREMKRKVDAIYQNQVKSKPHMVRASVILEVTGWTSRRLRQARDAGEIAYREENGTYRYDLNSLHPYMLKSKNV